MPLTPATKPKAAAEEMIKSFMRNLHPVEIDENSAMASNDEVQLYAFDCLALDGEDLRALPLSTRKTNLARLLARRPDIFAAPYELGEIGPDLFRAACRMGLEGLVSKRRDRPYRTGRSRDWIKIKNRRHPAMARVKYSSSRRLNSV
jgi:ATP-dependent DNA ligase